MSCDWASCLGTLSHLSWEISEEKCWVIASCCSSLSNLPWLWSQRLSNFHRFGNRWSEECEQWGVSCSEEFQLFLRPCLTQLAVEEVRAKGFPSVVVLRICSIAIALSVASSSDSQGWWMNTFGVSNHELLTCAWASCFGNQLKN